jgi:hypothetical protein
MMFLKNFENYKLFEFANNEIIPDISYERFSIRQSIYNINVDELEYMVSIETIGKIDSCILKIDFALIKNNKYSVELTNEYKQYKVLANVVGVIKYHLSKNEKGLQYGEMVNYQDMNVVSIIIASRSEKNNDDRRKNIYEYYIKKNLNKLGINILDIVNVTDKFKEMNNSGENYIVTKYKIEPIKIKDIK